jgi:NAD(P)-dependent dehydrogenase (short-subunit alcohol dehydrogenase family)
MFVKALLQNGAAKVYIAGRRKEKLDEVTSSLGDKVVGVQCDVTSKSDLQNMVSQIEKDTGYVNLLVCNSGIGGPQVKPLTPETTLEEWAKSNFDTDFGDYVNTFAINTASVWFTSMAFLPLLKKGNEKGNVEQTSQVIVTSSIAAFNKKAPGGWAYGQSKAGAVLAAKQLAVALPQWNIRANCIAPGCESIHMSMAKWHSNSSQYSPAKCQNRSSRCIPMSQDSLVPCRHRWRHSEEWETRRTCRELSYILRLGQVDIATAQL